LTVKISFELIRVYKRKLKGLIFVTTSQLYDSLTLDKVKVKVAIQKLHIPTLATHFLNNTPTIFSILLFSFYFLKILFFNIFLLFFFSLSLSLSRFRLHLQPPTPIAAEPPSPPCKLKNPQASRAQVLRALQEDFGGVIRI
jgi:hypothetical protein